MNVSQTIPSDYIINMATAKTLTELRESSTNALQSINLVLSEISSSVDALSGEIKEVKKDLSKIKEDTDYLKVETASLKRDIHWMKLIGGFILTAILGALGWIGSMLYKYLPQISHFLNKILNELPK